jgi:hypothetical protein
VRIAKQLAIGFAVALASCLSQPGEAAAKPVTQPAEVLTVSKCADGRYAAYGVIRWKAFKGVDSYTVLFDDSALGGPQEVTVTEPFSQDDFNEEFPIPAPDGTHQIIWTGVFGPCESEPPDFSERITNARVEFTRRGEYVEGSVRRPCVAGECETEPVRGVRVTAGGSSDTTNFDGEYSIKLPKPGTYDVTPRKGDLTFKPASKRVKVGSNSTATANFSADSPLVELSGEVTGRLCTDGHGDLAPGCGPFTHLDKSYLQVSSYGVAPAPAAADIRIDGPNGSFTANANKKAWSTRVPAGRYTLTLTHSRQPGPAAEPFALPAVRRVTATEDKDNLDFMICAIFGLETFSLEASFSFPTRSFPCGSLDPVKVRVVDVDGEPFPEDQAAVEVFGDSAPVGRGVTTLHGRRPDFARASGTLFANSIEANGGFEAVAISDGDVRGGRAEVELHPEVATTQASTASVSVAVDGLPRRSSFKLALRGTNVAEGVTCVSKRSVEFDPRAPGAPQGDLIDTGSRNALVTITPRFIEQSFCPGTYGVTVLDRGDPVARSGRFTIPAG